MTWFTGDVNDCLPVLTSLPSAPTSAGSAAAVLEKSCSRATRHVTIARCFTFLWNLTCQQIHVQEDGRAMQRFWKQACNEVYRGEVKASSAEGKHSSTFENDSNDAFKHDCLST